jgi:hypothetical protein
MTVRRWPAYSAIALLIVGLGCLIALAFERYGRAPAREFLAVPIDAHHARVLAPERRQSGSGEAWRS